MNQISLNTASNACGRARRWGEALDLFQKGTATPWSYGVLMSGRDDWSSSLQLLRRLLAAALELDEVLLHSVQWQVALQLIKKKKMKQQKLLFETYCRGSCWRQALQVMTLQMLSSESHGVQVISSCGSESAWEWALWLYGALKERRLASKSSSAAISACRPRWEFALELFWETSQPDAVSYSALISACEQGSQWPLALDLLRSALQEALELDTAMYNVVLSASQTGPGLHTFKHKDKRTWMK